MPLPRHLSADERAIVETARRQLSEIRRPVSEQERTAVKTEADQMAAEMIAAARAESWVEEIPEDEMAPETETERILRGLREGTGSFEDPTRGSLTESYEMETEGTSHGEWLPLGASSPPAEH